MVLCDVQVALITIDFSPRPFGSDLLPERRLARRRPRRRCAVEDGDDDAWKDDDDLRRYVLTFTGGETTEIDFFLTLPFFSNKF